jgi:hypothetical protein
MFKQLTDFCAWLDKWLETHLGRPYNALLSVGLVLEMSSKISSLPKTWGHAHLSTGTLLGIAMEAALLINQLGEFSHRRHARAARKAAKAAGPVAGAPHLEGDPAPPAFEELPRRLGRLVRRLRDRS